MSYRNTRQEVRTPITVRIKFKSETLEDFIERFSVDVSAGGIFVRTTEPLAVGTSINFEFQLADASPLISGSGTIVWTREDDSKRAGVAAGMGVRFDELTPPSKETLDKILAQKARQRTGKRVVSHERATSATEAQIDELRDRSKRPTAIDYNSSERARAAIDDDDATRVGNLGALAQRAENEDPFDDGDMQTAVATRAELQEAVDASTREVVVAAPSVDYNQARSLPPSDDELTVGVQHSDLATPPPEFRTAKPISNADSDAELEQWKAERERKKRLAKEEAARKIAEAARDPKRQRAKHRLLSEQMAIAGAKPEEIEHRLGSELEPVSRGSALWIIAGVILLIGGAATGYYFFIHKRDQPTEPKVIRPPGQAERSPARTMTEGTEILIDSKPSGAKVVLAPTKQAGVTPFTFTGLTAGNSYTVRLSKPGYKSRTVSIVAKSGTTPKPFSLEAMPRALSIITDPPSATILINDKRVGRSPKTVPLRDELDTEELSVELKKSGYKPMTVPVSLDAAGSNKEGVWVIELHKALVPKRSRRDSESQ